MFVEMTKFPAILPCRRDERRPMFRVIFFSALDEALPPRPGNVYDTR